MDSNTHACQQLNMELADARRPDCQVEMGKLHLASNRLTSAHYIPYIHLIYHTII